MSSKVITNPNTSVLPGMNRTLPSGCGNFRGALESNNQQQLLFAALNGNRIVRRQALRNLRKLTIKGGL